MNDNIKSEGFVTLTIDYGNGSQEIREFKNTVLLTGKYALASSLAGKYGDSYDYNITRMIFGTNGTNNGVPKIVVPSQPGLFGPTLLTKPLAITIDPEIPSQIVFTAVIGCAEGNGNSINEMALRMANGELYSMATFPDLNKTSLMQLTWNWRLSFI